MDIDHDTMQIIEADAKLALNPTETALRKVFSEWLKKNENPDWSDIEKALKVMGERVSRTKP